MRAGGVPAKNIAWIMKIAFLLAQKSSDPQFMTLFIKEVSNFINSLKRKKKSRMQINMFPAPHDPKLKFIPWMRAMSKKAAVAMSKLTVRAQSHAHAGFFITRDKHLLFLRSNVSHIFYPPCGSL